MATDTTGWTREQVLEARKFYCMGAHGSRGGERPLDDHYVNRLAKAEFPLPLITVPREMKATTTDRHAIWYRIVDGQLQYHLEYQDEKWHASTGLLAMTCSPSELEVIAELKRNPTSTREI